MKIVILTRKPDTLIPCVESIFQNEPGLPRDHIMIVKDGDPVTDELRQRLPGVTWLEGIRPFVWSRNMNIGLTHADDDCMMLNDDTTLETLEGFTKLANKAVANTNYGIISSALTGDRCNGNLIVKNNPDSVVKPVSGGRIPTIAVFLTKRVYKLVGPFDERFVKYGFDDDDYCLRIQKEKLWIGVYGGCVVRHHENRMTYHGPEVTNNITHWYDGDNEDIFRAKWGHR